MKLDFTHCGCINKTCPNDKSDILDIKYKQETTKTIIEMEFNGSNASTIYGAPGKDIYINGSNSGDVYARPGQDVYIRGSNSGKVHVSGKE